MALQEFRDVFVNKAEALAVRWKVFEPQRDYSEEVFVVGFDKAGFVPIHLAAAHVAKRIRDIDESHSYPTTLTALRQKGADGSLRMRGRKQLEVRDGTRFSDIHTNIPKEYWANSTIGALATSSSSLNDTHTNPETVWAWGPRGVYEPNRYADIQVEWSDVLKLWP